MNHVTSKDGTRIAFEVIGDGSPLVLVGGAFCDRHARAAGTPLAKLLAPHFVVVSYDRRGRGDSTDTPPWSVDREVEDIAALVAELGGRASLFGISSGGLLALEAARRELPLNAVAVYEAPVIVDSNRRPSEGLADELASLSAAGKRGEAAELFLGRVVGVPPQAIAGMKHAPMWRGLEALAHTLSYDVRLTASAVTLLSRLGGVRTPVVVLDGGNSPPILRDGARTLAKALPNGKSVTLEAQTHDVDPAVLAAALTEALRT